jgi:eukaryotic-like serine/threonine-protein kinase
MPLNPKRVQTVFLEAANYHDLADRAAILDRDCAGDSELRQRVEALLKAHDRFNDFVNQPLVGAGRRATWFYNVSDTKRWRRD